ncbi:hypothetical protein [Botrimarina hoheduenensis]|uniref:Uncharacterized protein n=1 Tax=Botrimarina hoheduenensis TaxID=2528000 RepID=A0A5C5VVV5_9BACT|nr:hypothetical protein [Botrimarina hoheduenensis]TWT42490.1 hypothetical protein Pla111_27950 [Botrimarina hoheduenensis]
MPRRKRVKWDHGDLFAVPLTDGSFGVVQAVDHWMPHWIYTAVTDQRTKEFPSSATVDADTCIISLIAVSDEEFDFGTFLRIGPALPAARRKDFPNEQFAHNGYIGAKSYTGGILTKFLAAWHGIASWTVFKDPEYFDKLLLEGVERPAHAITDGS